MILKSETQNSIMMGFIFTRISKSEILIISKHSGFWCLHWRNCFYNQLNPNLGGLFKGQFEGKEGGGITPCLKLVRIMQNVYFILAKNQHFLGKIIPLLKAILWELCLRFFSFLFRFYRITIDENVSFIDYATKIRTVLPDCSGFQIALIYISICSLFVFIEDSVSCKANNAALLSVKANIYLE